MLRVTDKHILIAWVTVAMASIFSPFASMHMLTDFAWWQIIAAFFLFSVPGHIGHSILSKQLGKFEMKGEATKK